jgi:hypothetical protein
MLTSSVSSELKLNIPAPILAALDAYAKERQFPIDLVIEMAIASFLDIDAVTFDDCKPVMTPGQLREENMILKAQLESGKKVDLTNFTVQDLI